MIRRWLGRIGLLSLVTLIAVIAVNWSGLRAFPGILPAFYAKEFCSCRFVMGQDDAYCHRYATQWLPISTFALDEAARRVTVRGTGATRSASWLSEREGCRLEP